MRMRNAPPLAPRTSEEEDRQTTVSQRVINCRAFRYPRLPLVKSEKPVWFERALDAPSERGDVDVLGARIHYEAWGAIGRPGIVLVHGSNAHLEWWRFVAPFLADRFRVAALDLSGNGDSGWRDRYSGSAFAEET